MDGAPLSYFSRRSARNLVPDTHPPGFHRTEWMCCAFASCKYCSRNSAGTRSHLTIEMRRPIVAVFPLLHRCQYAAHHHGCEGRAHRGERTVQCRSMWSASLTHRLVSASVIAMCALVSFTSSTPAFGASVGAPVSTPVSASVNALVNARATGGWAWPVAAPHPVVRGFEAPETTYSAGHRGIDVAAPAGVAT